MNLNALRKGERSFLAQRGAQRAQRLYLHVGLLGELRQKVGLREVRVHLAGRLREPALELVASPLVPTNKGMIDV